MPGKRIGILTGGGDVPGLNSVIKSVVYRATENNGEVVGIRRGWEGLTHVNLDDPESKSRYILPLTRENTRTVDRSGGTFLHSSRTNPSKMKSIPEFLKSVEFPKQEVTKKGVTSTEFDMSKERRTALVEAGCNAMRAYFNQPPAPLAVARGLEASEAARVKRMADGIALRLLGQ